MSAGGATLALAAMGQTIVILTGGFDLSAGRGGLAGQCRAGTCDGDRSLSCQVACFGCGARRSARLVGAFNGFFVAIVRLQPIVVTLSTMFIVQGITLLIMDKPGGDDRPGIRRPSSAGNAIPNVLPAPVVVVLVAAV